MLCMHLLIKIELWLIELLNKFVKLLNLVNNFKFI